MDELEREKIRKESLRGNLKRGERISETKLSALAPLLWFSLRIAPLRPAKDYFGQIGEEREAPYCSNKTILPQYHANHPHTLREKKE